MGRGLRTRPGVAVDGGSGGIGAGAGGITTGTGARIGAAAGTTAGGLGISRGIPGSGGIGTGSRSMQVRRALPVAALPAITLPAPADPGPARPLEPGTKPGPIRPDPIPLPARMPNPSAALPTTALPAQAVSALPEFTPSRAAERIGPGGRRRGGPDRERGRVRRGDREIRCIRMCSVRRSSEVLRTNADHDHPLGQARFHQSAVPERSGPVPPFTSPLTGFG